HARGERHVAEGIAADGGLVVPLVGGLPAVGVPTAPDVVHAAVALCTAGGPYVSADRAEGAEVRRGHEHGGSHVAAGHQVGRRVEVVGERDRAGFGGAVQYEELPGRPAIDPGVGG